MENKRGMEREVCFPLWRKRENFTRGKLTLQSYELLNLYALPPTHTHSFVSLV